MERIGVGYDLLTHESEILGRHFFDDAFARLKESGAVRLETEGKRRLLDDAARPERGVRRPRRPRQGDRPLRRHRHLCRQGHRLPAVEVRPPGPRLPLPALGRGGGVGDRARGAGHRRRPPRLRRRLPRRQRHRRPAELPGQDRPRRPPGPGPWRAGRALGPLRLRDGGAVAGDGAAPRLPRCRGRRRRRGRGCQRRRAHTRFSGRKGIGVKADDLLDQLEAKAREEIAKRNRDLDSLPSTGCPARSPSPPSAS